MRYNVFEALRLEVQDSVYLVFRVIIKGTQ